MVMLAARGLSADDVLAELARRFGISGHDEKASRKQTLMSEQKPTKYKEHNDSLCLCASVVRRRF